jgi:hypothetical protein
MQGNKRKSPFISFYSLFGIGTFQGVTAEKVKKYWTPSTRASGCPQSSQADRSLLHLFSLARPALRRAIVPFSRKCKLDSWFIQHFVCRNLRAATEYAALEIVEKGT